MKKKPVRSVDVPRSVQHEAPAVIPGGNTSDRMLGSPVPDIRDLIAARAYHLWTEAGCPSGCDQAHWFAAERDIRALPRDLATS